MGRRTEAACRLCRREGVKLYLKGIRCSGDKCAVERRNHPPGQHGARRGKISDYGLQLREKQKMKKIYGLLERQFRVFFYRASRLRGVTGENLISLLERRLDNAVFRLLWVSSRTEARQMVNHGGVLVNGRTVSIPSFIVRAGDKITLRAKEAMAKRVKENLEMLQDRSIPEWLSLDRNSLEAQVVRLPTKADAGLQVEESLVVELYSK